ncbi:MAG: 50S ribosomal protein L24 [Planctomycetota bacterium]
MPAHVRSGDTVIITAGAHKGKTGEIERVFPDDDKVIVKGINLRTKHTKPTRLNPRGGVSTKEAPIHISNVSPVVDGKACRVRFVTKDDGSKWRVAVQGGKEVKELGQVSPAAKK